MGHLSLVQVLNKKKGKVKILQHLVHIKCYYVLQYVYELGKANFFLSITFNCKWLQNITGDCEKKYNDNPYLQVCSVLLIIDLIFHIFCSAVNAAGAPCMIWWLCFSHYSLLFILCNKGESTEGNNSSLIQYLGK